MTSVSDNVLKIAAQNCEPLYLSDPFMCGGHDVEKANGTITFLRYCGEVYGVTCAHVFHQQIANGKWLTLHGIERYVYQLGSFTPSGYQSNFRPLRSDSGFGGPDIAIAHLGKSIEQIHFPRKNKSAIDLDAWSSPSWTEIYIPAAFGYPTEHKTQSDDYLQAPLVGVAANVTRRISEHDESFLLASSLPDENTYYFSGMSGGPVYHVPETGSEPILIGIVYEGSPGSSAEWEARDSQAFLTKNDIQIWAHTLTPMIFKQWLRLANLM